MLSHYNHDDQAPTISTADPRNNMRRRSVEGLSSFCDKTYTFEPPVQSQDFRGLSAAHRLDCPAGDFVPIAVSRVDLRQWNSRFIQVGSRKSALGNVLGRDQNGPSGGAIGDHAQRPARRRGCRRLAADKITIGEEDRRITEDEIEHGLFPAGNRHGQHRRKARRPLPFQRANLVARLQFASARSPPLARENGCVSVVSRLPASSARPPGGSSSRRPTPLCRTRPTPSVPTVIKMSPRGRSRSVSSRPAHGSHVPAGKQPG